MVLGAENNQILPKVLETCSFEYSMFVSLQRNTMSLRMCMCVFVCGAAAINVAHWLMFLCCMDNCSMLLEPVLGR